MNVRRIIRIQLGMIRAILLVCILLCATPWRSFAASVTFAPIPAVPTQEQCDAMNRANNSSVGAFLHASEAEEAAQFGTVFNGDRLRMQGRHITEWERYSDEASQRFIQCLREAQNARDAAGRSLAGDLSSGAREAWMSGIGSIPDSAWGGLAASNSRLVGFVAGASNAIRRVKEAEARIFHLQFAKDLLTTLATGSPPARSLSDRASFATEVTADLLGEGLPPWSVLFTTIAVNAVRAINNDAIRQLDTEMARFDAVAGPVEVSRAALDIERTYLAKLDTTIGAEPNNVLAVLSGLDAVRQEIADISKDVAAQVAATRRAEEARREALSEQTRRKFLADQAAAQAEAARQAQVQTEIQTQREAQRRAQEAAEERAQPAQMEDDDDEPAYTAPRIFSVPGARAFIPMPQFRPQVPQQYYSHGNGPRNDVACSGSDPNCRH